MHLSICNRRLVRFCDVFCAVERAQAGAVLCMIRRVHERILHACATSHEGVSGEWMLGRLAQARRWWDHPNFLGRWCGGNVRNAKLFVGAASAAL